MDELLSALRAVAEATRLRIIHLLASEELNVTELTQILGQSQPRVSRHLKLLVDAGVLDRFKEGSWVLFRLKQGGAASALGRDVIRLLPQDDPMVVADRRRLGEVIQTRRDRAERYFSANAANWHKLRRLHVEEAQVERTIMDLAGDGPFGTILDLGTGTGRMMELLASNAEVATGFDSSQEMLAIARAAMRRADLGHVQMRHGDIYALPLVGPVADLVTIHQVLHYLDHPARVIGEASRVLKPGGRLLIVDFAPHDLEFLRDEHTHRRLGFSDVEMTGWLERAGLKVIERRQLAPAPGESETGLTVSIWLARKALVSSTADE